MNGIYFKRQNSNPWVEKKPWWKQCLSVIAIFALALYLYSDGRDSLYLVMALRILASSFIGILAIIDLYKFYLEVKTTRKMNAILGILGIFELLISLLLLFNCLI